MGRHSASETADITELLAPPGRRSLARQARAIRSAAARDRRRRWGTRWSGAALVALAGSGVLMATGGTAGADNVVSNSSLDSGLAGWGVNAGAVLQQVQGRSGTAARITQDVAPTWTIAMNDSVNSVSSTVEGSAYRAQVWVRGTQPGLKVSLRVMEYQGSRFLGQALATATLQDTHWHRLRLGYVARTSGASLDLNVVAHQLPRGAGVDVDDVRLSAPGVSSSPASRPAGPEAEAPSVAGESTSTTEPTATEDAPGGAARASEHAEPEASSASATPGASPKRAAPTTEAPASSAPKPVAPSGWRQVWADEFAGSSVDSSRWRIEDHSTYGDGNKELACLMNRPENLNVSGGVLHLVARRESTPVQCGSSDARFPGGRTYTSAHLTTKGKADWTYGRFEVRAKLPTAAGSTKGLWPAFWLRPTAGGTGELDVLEAIGSEGSGSEQTKVHQTIWYDYSGTHKQQPTTVTVPNGLPSAGYHVYATEWEPGEIRWYIDGALTYTRTLATTPWLDSAFNKPFYLRLNLAIGGGWPGSPTSSTQFPASYDVDYVRVYQR
jgi:beta-glucanase (GH16 family)